MEHDGISTMSATDIIESNWFKDAFNTSGSHADGNLDGLKGNHSNETDIFGSYGDDAGDMYDFTEDLTLPPIINDDVANSPTPYSPPEHNMIVVGVLIGLIVVLCIVLGIVTVPPLCACIRRKLPVSQKRIDRRYATIDGWLITKPVKPHDGICEQVQRQYGLKQPNNYTIASSTKTPENNKITQKSSTLSTSVETTSSTEEEGTTTTNSNLTSIVAATEKTTTKTKSKTQDSWKKKQKQQQINDESYSSESSVSLSSENEELCSSSSSGSSSWDDDDDDDDDDDRLSEEDENCKNDQIADDHPQSLEDNNEEQKIIEAEETEKEDTTIGNEKSSHSSRAQNDMGRNISYDDEENNSNGISRKTSSNSLSCFPVSSCSVSHGAFSSSSSSSSCSESSSSHSMCSSSVGSRPCCPICIEDFKVGEPVSWSASVKCGHVFHHDCIKEWLLRRVGCPCCRETFLPVDRMTHGGSSGSTGTSNTSGNYASNNGGLREATNAPTYNSSRGDHEQSSFAVSESRTNNSDGRNSSTNDGRVNRFALLGRRRGMHGRLHHEQQEHQEHQEHQSQQNDGQNGTARRLLRQRRGRVRIRSQMLQEMSKERADRAASTYFCVQDGLITLRIMMQNDSKKRTKKAKKRKQNKQSTGDNKKDSKGIDTTELTPSNGGIGNSNNNETSSSNNNNNNIDDDDKVNVQKIPAATSTSSAMMSTSAMAASTRTGFAGRWLARLLPHQTQAIMARTSRSFATTSPTSNSGQSRSTMSELQADNVQLVRDDAEVVGSNESYNQNENNNGRISQNNSINNPTQLQDCNETFLEEDESSYDSPANEEEEDIEEEVDDEELGDSNEHLLHVSSSFYESRIDEDEDLFSAEDDLSIVSSTSLLPLETDKVVPMEEEEEVMNAELEADKDENENNDIMESLASTPSSSVPVGGEDISCNNHYGGDDEDDEEDYRDLESCRERQLFGDIFNKDDGEVKHIYNSGSSQEHSLATKEEIPAIADKPQMTPSTDSEDISKDSIIMIDEELGSASNSKPETVSSDTEADHHESFAEGTCEE